MHFLGFGWTDAAGTRRTPQVGRVLVRNQLDLVSSIKAGDRLTGTVTWKARVPAGARSVEFWADNEKLYTDPKRPFRFVLDTTDLSNGTHFLGFGWTDATGTRRTPQVGRVLVENAG